MAAKAKRVKNKAKAKVRRASAKKSRAPKKTTRPSQKTRRTVKKTARTTLRTVLRGLVKRVTRAPARKAARKPVQAKKRAAKKSVQKRTRAATKKGIKRAAKRTKTRAPRKRMPAPPTRPGTVALQKLLLQQANLVRPPVTPPPVIATFLAELQRKFPGASVLAGGSFAKGTSLRGKHDVDVFVRFPLGTADSHMSAALRKAYPTADVLHGSRDYLQVQRGGITFEIVPVLHVTAPTELVNVTDMSPLHVAYVRDHLSTAQKDDVRLAKRFTKAAGVYGAESHVRGFSGYVLELLISHYGSFEKLLRASLRWSEQEVIDPAQHYADSASALRHLNESKLGPLVLVDPLDPTRNAAAAVSAESIRHLRAHAANFLEKPSAVFFDATVRPAAIRAAWKPATTVFVRVKTPSGRQDIVGSRVLAGHEATIAALNASEFALLHTEWRFDEKECIAWYVLGTMSASKLLERRGPPSTIAHAVEAFRSHHKGAYERAGRWYTKAPRPHTEALAAITSGWKGFSVKTDPTSRPATNTRATR